MIPKENEKDLAEIPDNVKRGLEIIPADSVDQVLEHALQHPPTPIESPDEEVEAVPASGPEDDHTGVTTH